MARQIYLVRHCRAVGQDAEAPLTAEGLVQAELLAEFLARHRIDRIVSSPFLRARQSVAPLASRLGLDVHVDDRLVERVLSSRPLDDWRDQLRASYDDLDLRLEGGESSGEARSRAVAAVADVLRHGATSTVVVTHGNLMTLLLGHFDPRFGFADWERLTNPDVFRIAVGREGTHVERLWTGG